ncbi:MAG: nuclear transport factor 2 family protein [Pseudomonadota bacterium]
MTPDQKAVHEAVEQWFIALNAMLAGDPEPFSELYSHASDVTYMGAEGTYRMGWADTYADWKTQAERSLGGTVSGENIHVVVEGTLAMASHFTKGTVTAPDGKATDLLVRETSVFRKEHGTWKLIAHQADDHPIWASVIDG